jgi:hypothetical protein|tara:strand:+ start:1368 stop:1613 length:246 start_codon:yes stop_codon:yes gene_type:complete
MEKSTYIKIKSEAPLQLVYELYKERFDSNKYSLFLNQNDFYRFIQMWNNLNNLCHQAIEYYDTKFEIVTLADKDGKALKYM